MNKTGIEWCDMTWNPVTGCLHDCRYCYARERVIRFQGYDLEGEITTFNPFDGPAVLDNPLYISDKYGKSRRAAFPYGFDPTFHKYRLNEPTKNRNPKTIFVGSMTDLFGYWVPDEWIEQVFEICREAPWHRYIFLTKNPKRYSELLASKKLLSGDNIWYGTTVTSGKDMKRAEDLYALSPHGVNTFISAEPLLGEIKFGMLPDWCIIGAETGRSSGRVTPERSWVQNIVNVCREAGVPVFMKNSIAPFWDGPIINELPWEVAK